MTHFRDIPEFDVHELPEDLQVIDARLAHMARSAPVPVGLVERVFEASVSSLPQTQQPLRVAGAGRWQQRLVYRQAWARLAMAAAVLLVAGLGIHFMSGGPNTTPSISNLVVAFDSTAAAGEIVSVFEGMPQHSTDLIDNEMGYLLETNELDSLHDIAGELALVVAELEM